MNYTLQIDLAGAEQVGTALDNLIEKISKAGSGVMPSLSDYLAEPKGIENIGEKMGKSLGEGIGKGVSKALVQGPDLDGVLRKAFQKDELAAKRQMADRASFEKNMSMLAGPLLNPGGGLSTMFAGRQVYSALMTNTGQGMLGKFGLSGTSGAAVGALALTGAATALGASFAALKKVVDGVLSSYERARMLYAKSLMNGLGLGVSTQRSQLSSILGVSETDVFKFGAALDYLNPKLEWSSSILAKTAPQLTATSWSFKILTADFNAMNATIGEKISPALRKLIDGLDGIVKVATSFFNVITNFASQHPAIFNLFNEVFRNQFGSPALNAGITGSRMIAGFGKDSGAAPLPEPRMNQLAASAWEKMGLVVGSGGQSTNDLIRESNRHLRDIASTLKKIPNRGGGYTFGMSPQTSNP